MAKVEVPEEVLAF